jgi:site-specific DNA-cytosine methylase
MKILYLAAGHGSINTNHEVVYQDLIIKRDLGGDMLDIDLNGYDLIIATPPCNYYSRANYRRKTSKYSNDTKHLLPEIISKLESTDVPVIIENVINKKRMSFILEKTSLFYIEWGRHCYFTNRLVDFSSIPQKYDFEYGGKSVQKCSKKARQGGKNVQLVFEHYIETYL